VIRYFDGLQPFAGAPDVVNHVDDATFAKMKEIGLNIESYSGKTRSRDRDPLALPDRPHGRRPLGAIGSGLQGQAEHGPDLGCGDSRLSPREGCCNPAATRRMK
jgi:hypothetical protein